MGQMSADRSRARVHDRCAMSALIFGMRMRIVAFISSSGRVQSRPRKSAGWMSFAWRVPSVVPRRNWPSAR